MTKPIIVSYYTENTPYEKEAKDLIHSCQSLNLEHHIVPTPNLGSWSNNCCYKPKFLLNLLETLKRPLIWTDVDSIVRKAPTFFDTCKADIAAKIDHDLPLNDKSRILTSTFFINHTQNAIALLKLWDTLSQKGLEQNPLYFDQSSLNDALQQFPLTLEELPPNYLVILNHPKHPPPEEAVFLHYQASRIYQKVMDQELSPSLIDWFSSEELKDFRS